MGHRELVRIHKEFVGQSGSHLEKLEPAQVVVGHETSEILPAPQYGVSRFRVEQPVLKQSLDLIARKKRKNILIPAHPIWLCQRVNASLHCFISWERTDSRRDRFADPAG